MLEADIKQSLRSYLSSQISVDEFPLLLEELRLSGGAARADLVDAKTMHCYEIKSERDSLRRLVSQGSRYIRVFDKITLVIAESHLELALQIIPLWWGVLVVDSSKKYNLRKVRKAKRNPQLASSQLAKILTKDECLEFLEREGLVKGKKSLSLYRLHEYIVENFSLDRLMEVVMNALQARVQLPIAA